MLEASSIMFLEAPLIITMGFPSTLRLMISLTLGLPIYSPLETVAMEFHRAGRGDECGCKLQSGGHTAKENFTVGWDV